VDEATDIRRNMSSSDVRKFTTRCVKRPFM